MLKEKILKCFIENNNKLISANYLSSKLGVSRNAISKHLNNYIKLGYNFEVVKNKGYIFHLPNNPFDTLIINYYYNTAHKIAILNTVDSTNNYIKQTDFDLVIAKMQTAGKGRMNRKFISNLNSGVYFTTMINNVYLPFDKVAFITIYTVLAIKRAIKQLYNYNINIKWLNDVYINNLKVGGILTEAVIDAETKLIQNIVIGIGLNIWAVDASLNTIATYLNTVVEVNDINYLIATIINELHKLYDQDVSHSEVLQEYKASLFILNQEVEVNDFSKKYFATVIDINEAGHLIVKDHNNDLQTLYSGEVSLKL